jgi:hypothetical protein
MMHTQLIWMQIMARKKPSWATNSVKSSEFTATSACAIYHPIRLSVFTITRVAFVMPHVLGNRSYHLYIVWLIVSLFPIDVMNYFPLAEVASYFFTCHKAVLIDIASNVSQWVTRHSQQDIAVRGYHATALPI